MARASTALGRPAPAVITVGVVDTSRDGQSLLNAMLFALGCRVIPLDCDADSGGAIGPQIQASEADVVVWQIPPRHGAAGGPLMPLLASRVLGEVAVVVISTTPDETAVLLRPHHVQVLAAPVTAAALMGAVREAQASRAGSAPPRA